MECADAARLAGSAAAGAILTGAVMKSETLMADVSIAAQMAQLLHICYVITRSDVMGGASVHLLDLAQGMQQAGHRVTILIGGDGLVNQRARARGLTVIPLAHLVRPIHPYHDLACWFELRRQFKQLKPDVIHLHSSKAGLVGRLAALKLGVPVLFTAHGWAFTEGVSGGSSLLYRVLERLVAPLTDRIITVSEYDRQRALQCAVGNPDLLQTVHNGMPAVAAHLTQRGTDSNGQHQPNRLVMVARFEQPKDHQLLLQALAQVSGDWQLQLIGDGPLLAQAKQTAAQLQLTQRIEFAGARDDVAQQLANASVFVLLSRWEGLPLTILEAMRAGLAVVASRVGGVPELVEPGVTGLLVDNEPAQVASALQQLLDDVALQRQFGDAGQQRFAKYFTFERMLARTGAIYQQLVSARRLGKGSQQ